MSHLFTPNGKRITGTKIVANASLSFYMSLQLATMNAKLARYTNRFECLPMRKKTRQSNEFLFFVTFLFLLMMSWMNDGPTKNHWKKFSIFLLVDWFADDEKIQSAKWFRMKTMLNRKRHEKYQCHVMWFIWLPQRNSIMLNRFFFCSFPHWMFSDNDKIEFKIDCVLISQRNQRSFQWLALGIRCIVTLLHSVTKVAPKTRREREKENMFRNEEKDSCLLNNTNPSNAHRNEKCNSDSSKNVANGSSVCGKCFVVDLFFLFRALYFVHFSLSFPLISFYSCRILFIRRNVNTIAVQKYEQAKKKKRTEKVILRKLKAPRMAYESE